MNKPISVGDLVQIVRTDCEESARKVVGLVYTVGGIGTEGRHCNWCKQEYPASAIALFAGTKRGAPLPWLKRIPPLEELEGEKTQEDIREPA